ncbi:MAG: sulfatase-like hydrolase/transferase, partial [Blastopirellula sp. JB062]
MVAGSFAFSLVLANQANAAQPKRPPNIVFFLVDDLGWTDLGCYGSSFYETPHVDRLADTGLRFTNAYAPCSVCVQTRYGLLTGRYPFRADLNWRKRSVIAPDRMTLG